jgi:hypothetical protein
MKYLILILIILLAGCSKDITDRTDINFVITVCLEGHTYYYTDMVYQGGIAPKLTDDGKPVHCLVEDK